MFVKIKAYEVGLVFENGAYIKMLNEGWNLVWPWQTVYRYDMSMPFNPPCDLKLLQSNDELMEILNVVEVKDTEIALVYEDGLFKRVLTAGRHGFWKGVKDYTFTLVNLAKVEVTEAIDTAVLMKNEVYYYVRVFAVQNFEKGLLFVDNRFVKVLEPGLHYYWKNNTPVSVQVADTRQLQLEMNGQEILTKDKACLRVNFNAQYRIADVVKALVQNKEYEKQLYALMQLALREYVGSYTLDEILERKEAVAPFVMQMVADKTEQLGVVIVNCGMRDIILPGEMRDIMNQVLIAEKRAQANTIMRREETASTRSLLNTAKLMEENEMLYKLKEMEYVERIAEKINSITVSGGNQVVDQLKQIFTPAK